MCKFFLFFTLLRHHGFCRPTESANFGVILSVSYSTNFRILVVLRKLGADVTYGEGDDCVVVVGDSTTFNRVTDDTL